MHMRVMINVYFRMFGKIKAFLTSWYCFIKKKIFNYSGKKNILIDPGGDV